MSRRVTALVGVFARSFYSPTAYLHVGASWKGLGVGYLLVVVVVWAVPDMIRQYHATTTFAESYVRDLFWQVPEMKLQDGILLVKDATPHYVKDPVNGVQLIIIDTTGKTVSLENGAAKVLLTKTQTIYSQGSNNIKHAPHGHKPYLVNKEALDALRDRFNKWFFPMYAIAVVAAKSIMFGLLAMAGVAVGVVYARLVGSTLGLFSIARIAAVAVTPSIIVYSLMELGLVRIPQWWLWAFVISCSYTIFGIRSNIAMR